MAYEDSFRSAAMPVKKAHGLSLADRRTLSLTGVEDAGSFDEREIRLSTSCGGLTICGEELSVSRLDLEAGEVEVRGRVTELRYTEPEAEGRGFWSRLFG